MGSSGGVGGVLPDGMGGQRQRQISPITKCAGCKVVDAAKTLGSLVSYALDGEATKEEQERRKAICAACDAVDSSGARLYREGADGPTCGVPRLEELLRDSAVDGCGCYLEKKWTGKNQECPLGKWKLNG
jgi:hypothetical protein